MPAWEAGALPLGYTRLWCPRVESNHGLIFRRDLFYPLNYGGKLYYRLSRYAFEDASPTRSLPQEPSFTVAPKSSESIFKKKWYGVRDSNPRCAWLAVTDYESAALAAGRNPAYQLQTYYNVNRTIIQKLNCKTLSCSTIELHPRNKNAQTRTHIKVYAPSPIWAITAF